MPDRSRGELERAYGQCVRELRQRTGMSQERLADVCGRDRTYIGRLEQGMHSPSLRTIFALAEVLETTPDAMVRRVRAMLDESSLPRP